MSTHILLTLFISRTAQDFRDLFIALNSGVKKSHFLLTKLLTKIKKGTKIHKMTQNRIMFKSGYISTFSQ